MSIQIKTIQNVYTTSVKNSNARGMQTTDFQRSEGNAADAAGGAAEPGGTAHKARVSSSCLNSMALPSERPMRCSASTVIITTTELVIFSFLHVACYSLLKTRKIGMANAKSRCYKAYMNAGVCDCRPSRSSINRVWEYFVFSTASASAAITLALASAADEA